MFFNNVKRILHLLFCFIYIAFLACILGSTCVLGASRNQKSVRSPRDGDGCELPCGCWELNPGPLQEQQMLFNHQGHLSGFSWNFKTNTQQTFVEQG